LLFHVLILVFSAKDQLMAPEVNPSEALDAVGALLALRSGAGASATLHIFQEFLRLRYDSSGNKFINMYRIYL
jgi:hypothetical protein